MKKNCVVCGKEFFRKRYKNGKLESTFKNKIFCSSKCYGVSITKENITHDGHRKRCQRNFELKNCERCGDNKKLHRHHIDGNIQNNSLVNIKILCQSCHIKEHEEKNHWGKPKRKEKNCAVCQKLFMPRHSKKHKTCSSECFSKICKMNAYKRWGNSVCVEQTKEAFEILMGIK